MSQMSHRFARMTSMMLQPAAMGAAFDHFRDASAPAVRAQPGSLAILGGGNPDTGFGCAISFWETLDSLERSNANPKVVEAMSGYAQWMAGPFRVESYSVTSGSPPDPDVAEPPQSWMRMTTATAAPGKLETVLMSYSDRLDQARERSESCVWTTLLAPQIGSRILVIEQWTSLPALLAWEGASKDADQRLFRAEVLETPPVRDRLAVYGLY